MIMAIIQARMSSKRLPGKVMLPIKGKPMLQWVIEAALNADMVDQVVVATSLDSTDNPMVDFMIENDFCMIYRGSLNDVLHRFYDISNRYKPSHIVRLTADCPRLSSSLIDQVIIHHLTSSVDYTRNSKIIDNQRVGAPSGFNVEVFTANALNKTANEAHDSYDREHVTPFMQRGQFRVAHLLDDEFPSGKWSVDTFEDYKKVRKEMEDD